jgi:gas vesicle protein
VEQGVESSTTIIIIIREYYQASTSPFTEKKTHQSSTMSSPVQSFIKPQPPGTSDWHPNHLLIYHMSKSQCRNVKQQDNSSPSKANSTTRDVNICEEEKISNTEFQKIMVRMINELKEETQKLVTDFKEEMSKQLNELKENTNKQMNEIKKTMQDMKEKINKDMEVLKNNQSEINSTISKIKISIESLANRVEQVENRI